MWDKRGSQPSFPTQEEMDPPDYMRYLWGGNVPAYDILNLETHEGKAFDGDLTLCFASSGDPRNLIESVIALPEGYTGAFTCIANEQDVLVVVRNVMILMAPMLLAPTEAAEFMLHLWYSARLTPKMVDVIAHIRTLITAAMKEFDGKGEGGNLCRSTWDFGTQQLSLSLTKDTWSLVLEILSSHHVSSDIELSFKKPAIVTEDRRRHVMLASHLLDQRESHLFDLPPSQRLSAQRMRETGILSPFGSDITAFTHANPTFYDVDSGQWLQHPLSDPLSSYSIDAILRSGTNHHVPANDIYGSLHTHILSRLTAFIAKSASTNISIHLFSLLPPDLPTTLFHSLNPFSTSAFDRISTSSLAEHPSIGLKRTLTLFGPLLKTPSQNPHARLLTLFAKAANDTHTPTTASNKKDASIVAEFLPAPDSTPGDTLSAEYAQFMAAMKIVRDYSASFARYMQKINFADAADATDMAVVETNTVVEAWPTRLKKRAGEEGAQRAFELALRSDTTGCERFVEWVRKEPD